MNLADKLTDKIKEQCGSRSVVVIGDTMVDRWVHGHTADCQDGCRKFVQKSVVETPGGAANAHRSIYHWHTTTRLFGFAENDCPVKCRYVEGDKIVFRTDDDGPPTRMGRYDWARDEATRAVNRAGAVLLSDYDKGFLTSEFIRQVSDLCHDRGIPCVADCKREPKVYGRCIIKGNLEWFMKYQHRPHVLTAGQAVPTVNGVMVQDARYSAVPCANHVGAGDCLAAHLTLALAYGFSLKEAAILAHSAGRVYVQHPHNRPPTPDEVAADLATAP